jgi:sigma-B regulation protein RsbU (phosphoserine phosphatase)
MVKGGLTGILAVYNRKAGRKFDADDQRLLAIIASQSAQVIETTRLYEEERALARMRHQVSLAAEIQQHLLPSSLPTIDGYDLAGTSIAAEIVGGDYFDVIPTPGGKWSLCLGDVSGKGIPASLLMSNVQAMVRLLARMNVPPCESIRRANELLLDCTPPEKFVTFFLAVLDPATGRVEFCNAGHNAPLLVTSAGDCRRLSSEGAVLGIIPGFAYAGSACEMERDDVIVIFSDGVTEALSADDDEFGEERLLEVVREHAPASAQTIQEAILAEVRAHAGIHPQSDDITLVVLKRDGRRP